MPGPNPNAVWIEEGWDGRLTATFEVFLITDRTARKKRAQAMLRNVARGGWLCRWCDESVLHFRRSNARFCGEICRKKAARNGAAVTGAELRAHRKAASSRKWSWLVARAWRALPSSMG